MEADLVLTGERIMTTQTQSTELSTAAATTPSLSKAKLYTVDPEHTQLGFRVRHMMVSWTRGHFRKFEGTVRYDEAHPEQTQVDVKVDVASVDTTVAKRDEHLRSADFFDAEKFPTLTFRSTHAKQGEAGKLLVTGNLTLRGVTRPVVLEVGDIGESTKDPWGSVHRGATAQAKLSRKDFGLTWNAALEAGGVLVGEEVLINLEIELLEQTNK
jgi:polyisoprenoid-binding protein YceI